MQLSDFTGDAGFLHMSEKCLKMAEERRPHLPPEEQAEIDKLVEQLRGSVRKAKANLSGSAVTVPEGFSLKG